MLISLKPLKTSSCVIAKEFSPFKRITITGRLSAFGPGSELEKVRQFFKSYHHSVVNDRAMLITVDEVPKKEWKYPVFFTISILLVILSFYFSIRGFFIKY